MTSPRYYAVHFEPRQLTTFPRLSALGNFYLQLLGVHEIFGSHAEAAARHLFSLAIQRNALHCCMKTVVIFTTLSGIAPETQGIHCHCYSLMRLLRKSPERHGARDKVPHYCLFALNFLNIDRIPLEIKEISNEYGIFLIVSQMREFLEHVIFPSPRRKLKRGYRLWVPCMLDAVFPVMQLAGIGKETYSFVFSRFICL